jgi:biopolymer transport protein ExbB/TolQ
MNSASKNAVSILIFIFIVCFFLLFAVLYGYHSRSLRKSRHTEIIEEQAPSPTAELQADVEDGEGLVDFFVDMFRQGSPERELIQQSLRRRDERIRNRQERIRNRSSNYRDQWVSIDEPIEIINRSGLSSRLAFIHTLELLPPLVIFLFVISFSMFFTLSPFQKESFQYHTIAIPSYFVLIAYIILIIFAEFLFVPRVFKKTEQILHQSRIAHAALAEAEKLNSTEDLERALEAVEIYLEIDSTNEDARSMQRAILEKMFQRTPARTQREEDTTPPEEDALTSYQKGQRAESDEEYTIAVYYFERALAVEGESREIREAYERVKREADNLLGTLSEDEKIVQRYIRTKEKAIEAFQNKDYYGAYKYITELLLNKDLQSDHPELYKDVELYYHDIQNELSQHDFLPKEIAPYEWLPSYDNIIFLEFREKNIGETQRKLILNSVERIIPWENQYYFIDIKRRIDGKWKTYAYGKWVNNRIRVKKGTDYEEVSPDQEELNYIKNGLHPQYLMYFNDNSRLVRQLDVYERFSLGTALKENGFNIEGRSYYLARKLGIFFSVYVLTLIFAGIAWTRRSIYNFPPRFKLLIFVIIMPVLSYLFHRLYLDVNSIFMYTHRYIVLYILKRGIDVALYTGIINLFIAVIATIFYLSQRSSVE